MDHPLCSEACYKYSCALQAKGLGVQRTDSSKIELKRRSSRAPVSKGEGRRDLAATEEEEEDSFLGNAAVSPGTASQEAKTATAQERRRATAPPGTRVSFSGEETASATPAAAAPSAKASAGLTLTEWLRGLEMEELLPSFLEKKYTSLSMIIAAGGLTDEDLDYIGIGMPIHRRLLKNKSAELCKT